MIGLALFVGVAGSPKILAGTPLTVSGLAVTGKVYDGSINATLIFSGATLNGVTNGDDVTLDTSSSTAAFGDKNVGSGKVVTTSLTLKGSAAANYTLTQPTGLKADITARPLGISASGSTKTYDATANATVALALINWVTGDDVAADYDTASFADKAAGINKPVQVDDLFITGTDAENYDLTNTAASTSATISARTLRVGASGKTKAYDGTTNATVTLSDNHLAGDTVTDSYTSAAFADPYVGTGKIISVSGIAISGADAGNYTLNSTTAHAQASITPRTLTVTATGQDKTYDGTTNATVTQLNDDRLANDDLTVSFSSASFSDKKVGDNKTVTVYGLVITGTDSDSYTLTNTTTTTTANISGRNLTVVAAGVSRAYDGTTNATVTLTDTRLTGDNLTNVYAAASFNDKNAGIGKMVTVTGISVTGPDAANYSLANTAATTQASITNRLLTVTAAGQDKTYDGTTNATVTLGDNRVVGDDLTDSYTSAGFADKNVGNAKPVKVTGIQVTGGDSGNYTLSGTTAATTASITARTLTVAATGQDKVYDGTTNASVTLSDNHLTNDEVTRSYVSAGFADKRVGSGKTITVAGISISGTDSGNYTLAGVNSATATANITPYSLAVTATATNKIYDGTVTATVSLQDNRVAGDVFTDGYGSASFTSSSVGSHTVNVTGIYITGTDAGNYTLGNTTAAATASITAGSASVALVSSENPAGFHDAIAFTETLPADATGTVTYYTNGTVFAAGSLNAGAFTSGSISNLLRGTNVITAIYSGDANYDGATNILAQVITNHPPVTGFFSFTVTNGASLKLKISDLLTAVADADGDSVALAGIGISTNGFTPATNATYLVFHNTNRVNDRFSYTVTDYAGGYATGQVTVAAVTVPFVGQATGQVSIHGGTNTVNFHGVPGFVYIVQRSVNLLTWVDIATNTAAGDGTILATDRFADLGAPPASAFYRLKWKP